MNFSFYVSISTGINTKIHIAPDLTKEINSIFSKSYGESVANIAIGFLMVLPRPGYEEWYKPKSLSYTEHKDVKSKLTGETIEKRKLLSFEVRLEADEIGAFQNGNDWESKGVLLDKTINYLKNLKKLPSKVKDFHLAILIEDLEAFNSHLFSNR